MKNQASLNQRSCREVSDDSHQHRGFVPACRVRLASLSGNVRNLRSRGRRRTDSGLTANGITEDKWVGANDPAEYLVVGRGFRVKVGQGNWVDTFDSDPETGCFSFSRNSSQGFAVRVSGLRDRQCRQPRADSRDAQTDTSVSYTGQYLLGTVDGDRRCRPTRRTTTCSTAARVGQAGPPSPRPRLPCIDTTTAMRARRSRSGSTKATAATRDRSTAAPRTTSRATRRI